MNNESGKTILGRTKTKVLMINKEELIDGITPLKSIQGIIGCCISTSLSMISFLSFLSISSSFVLNSFSCLTLSFSSNSFLSFPHSLFSVVPLLLSILTQISLFLFALFFEFLFFLFLPTPSSLLEV